MIFCTGVLTSAHSPGNQKNQEQSRLQDVKGGNKARSVGGFQCRGWCQSSGFGPGLPPGPHAAGSVGGWGFPCDSLIIMVTMCIDPTWRAATQPWFGATKASCSLGKLIPRLGFSPEFSEDTPLGTPSSQSGPPGRRWDQRGGWWPWAPGFTWLFPALAPCVPGTSACVSRVEVKWPPHPLFPVAPSSVPCSVSHVLLFLKIKFTSVRFLVVLVTSVTD